MINEEKLKGFLTVIAKINNAVFAGRDKQGNKISLKQLLEQVFEEDDK